MVAGLEKKKRLINPREKKIVAFHESGHALVGHALGSADAVQKISIVPRGIAALGYTIQLPTEDRYLVTKKELEEKLASLLGGRVAEEVFFNDVSTGAQNDLFKATDIARAMVKEYGMSSRMGLTSYERPRNPFLKGDCYMPTEKEYSEKIAAEIDDEVKLILEQAHETARTIIEQKRATVERSPRACWRRKSSTGRSSCGWRTGRQPRRSAGRSGGFRGGVLQGALGAGLDVLQERVVPALAEGEELEAQLLAVSRHLAGHRDDRVLHLQGAVLDLGSHLEVGDRRGAEREGSSSPGWRSRAPCRSRTRAGGGG